MENLLQIVYNYSMKKKSDLLGQFKKSEKQTSIFSIGCFIAPLLSLAGLYFAAQKESWFWFFIGVIVIPLFISYLSYLPLIKHKKKFGMLIPIKDEKFNKERIEAVKKLTDKTALEYIVKNYDFDIWIREAAERRYTEIRTIEIEELDDQVILVKTVKNEKEWSCEVRGTAVKKITDPAILIDVAKNDRDRFVAMAAVNNPNIIDQATLADIAKNAKDSYVRISAADKLNGCDLKQNVYAEIARSDEFSEFRNEVVKKLTDQVALADLAKNDKYYVIRKAAVNNPYLINQDILAEIAKKDEEENDVRLSALSKITDQNVKSEIEKMHFHDWKGCRCSICDATRHKWVRVKDSNEYKSKCARCGEEEYRREGRGGLIVGY